MVLPINACPTRRPVLAPGEADKPACFLALQINNADRDSGVLVGNWSGKYEDGVAPYTWNGSAAILEEFLKKRKGVKFGQCWTFAAVATTRESLAANVQQSGIHSNPPTMISFILRNLGYLHGEI